MSTAVAFSAFGCALGRCDNALAMLRLVALVLAQCLPPDLASKSLN